MLKGPFISGLLWAHINYYMGHANNVESPVYRQDKDKQRHLLQGTVVPGTVTSTTISRQSLLEIYIKRREDAEESKKGCNSSNKNNEEKTQTIAHTVRASYLRGQDANGETDSDSNEKSERDSNENQKGDRKDDAVDGKQNGAGDEKKDDKKDDEGDEKKDDEGDAENNGNDTAENKVEKNLDAELERQLAKFVRTYRKLSRAFDKLAEAELQSRRDRWNTVFDHQILLLAGLIFGYIWVTRNWICGVEIVNMARMCGLIEVQDDYDQGHLSSRMSTEIRISKPHHVQKNTSNVTFTDIVVPTEGAKQVSSVPMIQTLFGVISTEMDALFANRIDKKKSWWAIDYWIYLCPLLRPCLFQTLMILVIPWYLLVKYECLKPPTDNHVNYDPESGADHYRKEDSNPESPFYTDNFKSLGSFFKYLDFTMNYSAMNNIHKSSIEIKSSQQEIPNVGYNIGSSCVDFQTRSSEPWISWNHATTSTSSNDSNDHQHGKDHHDTTSTSNGDHGNNGVPAELRNCASSCGSGQAEYCYQFMIVPCFICDVQKWVCNRFPVIIIPVETINECICETETWKQYCFCCNVCLQPLLKKFGKRDIKISLQKFEYFDRWDMYEKYSLSWGVLTCSENSRLSFALSLFLFAFMRWIIPYAHSFSFLQEDIITGNRSSDSTIMQKKFDNDLHDIFKKGSVESSSTIISTTDASKKKNRFLGRKITEQAVVSSFLALQEHGGSNHRDGSCATRCGDHNCCGTVSNHSVDEKSIKDGNSAGCGTSEGIGVQNRDSKYVGANANGTRNKNRTHGNNPSVNVVAGDVKNTAGDGKNTAGDGKNTDSNAELEGHVVEHVIGDVITETDKKIVYANSSWNVKTMLSDLNMDFSANYLLLSLFLRGSFERLKGYLMGRIWSQFLGSIELKFVQDREAYYGAYRKKHHALVEFTAHLDRKVGKTLYRYDKSMEINEDEIDAEVDKEDSLVNIHLKSKKNEKDSELEGKEDTVKRDTAKDDTGKDSGNEMGDGNKDMGDGQDGETDGDDSWDEVFDNLREELVSDAEDISVTLNLYEKILADEVVKLKGLKGNTTSTHVNNVNARSTKGNSSIFSESLLQKRAFHQGAELVADIVNGVLGSSIEEVDEYYDEVDDKTEIDHDLHLLATARLEMEVSKRKETLAALTMMRRQSLIGPTWPDPYIYSKAYQMVTRIALVPFITEFILLGPIHTVKAIKSWYSEVISAEKLGREEAGRVVGDGQVAQGKKEKKVITEPVEARRPASLRVKSPLEDGSKPENPIKNTTPVKNTTSGKQTNPGQDSGENHVAEKTPSWLSEGVNVAETTLSWVKQNIPSLGLGFGSAVFIRIFSELFLFGGHLINRRALNRYLGVDNKIPKKKQVSDPVKEVENAAEIEVDEVSTGEAAATGTGGGTASGTTNAHSSKHVGLKDDGGADNSNKNGSGDDSDSSDAEDDERDSDFWIDDEPVVNFRLVDEDTWGRKGRKMLFQCRYIFMSFQGQILDFVNNAFSLAIMIGLFLLFGGAKSRTLEDILEAEVKLQWANGTLKLPDYYSNNDEKSPVSHEAFATTPGGVTFSEGSLDHKISANMIEKPVQVPQLDGPAHENNAATEPRGLRESFSNVHDYNFSWAYHILGYSFGFSFVNTHPAVSVISNCLKDIERSGIGIWMRHSKFALFRFLGIQREQAVWSAFYYAAMFVLIILNIVWRRYRTLCPASISKRRSQQTRKYCTEIVGPLVNSAPLIPFVIIVVSFLSQGFDYWVEHSYAPTHPRILNLVNKEKAELENQSTDPFAKILEDAVVADVESLNPKLNEENADDKKEKNEGENAEDKKGDCMTKVKNTADALLERVVEKGMVLNKMAKAKIAKSTETSTTTPLNLELLPKPKILIRYENTKTIQTALDKFHVWRAGAAEKGDDQSEDEEKPNEDENSNSELNGIPAKDVNSGDHYSDQGDDNYDSEMQASNQADKENSGLGFGLGFIRLFDSSIDRVRYLLNEIFVSIKGPTGKWLLGVLTFYEMMVGVERNIVNYMYLPLFAEDDVLDVFGIQHGHNYNNALPNNSKEGSIINNEQIENKQVENYLASLKRRIVYEPNKVCRYFTLTHTEQKIFEAVVPSRDEKRRAVHQYLVERDENSKMTNGYVEFRSREMESRSREMPVYLDNGLRASREDQEDLLRKTLSPQQYNVLEGRPYFRKTESQDDARSEVNEFLRREPRDYNGKTKGQRRNLTEKGLESGKTNPVDWSDVECVPSNSYSPFATFALPRIDLDMKEVYQKSMRVKKEVLDNAERGPDSLHSISPRSSFPQSLPSSKHSSLLIDMPSSPWTLNGLSVPSAEDQLRGPRRAALRQRLREKRHMTANIGAQVHNMANNIGQRLEAFEKSMLPSDQYIFSDIARDARAELQYRRWTKAGRMILSTSTGQKQLNSNDAHDTKQIEASGKHSNDKNYDTTRSNGGNHDTMQSNGGHDTSLPDIKPLTQNPEWEPGMKAFGLTSDKERAALEKGTCPDGFLPNALAKTWIGKKIQTCGLEYIQVPMIDVMQLSPFHSTPLPEFISDESLNEDMVNVLVKMQEVGEEDNAFEAPQWLWYNSLAAGNEIPWFRPGFNIVSSTKEPTHFEISVDAKKDGKGNGNMETENAAESGTFKAEYKKFLLIPKDYYESNFAKRVAELGVEPNLKSDGIESVSLSNFIIPPNGAKSQRYPATTNELITNLEKEMKRLADQLADHSNKQGLIRDEQDQEEKGLTPEEKKKTTDRLQAAFNFYVVLRWRRERDAFRNNVCDRFFVHAGNSASWELATTFLIVTVIIHVAYFCFHIFMKKAS